MIKELSEENQKKIEKLVISKNFSEIEKLIFSLKKKEQENPFILNLLGVCKISKRVSNQEIAKEEAKKSQELFKKAYEKDNNFIDALYNLAEVSLKTLNYDDAVIYLNNHLQKVIYDFRTVFFLARIHFHLGEIQKTINYYNKIIEKKDATKFIFTNHIYVYNYSNTYSQKQYNEFCKQYLESIKKIEENKFLKINYEKNPKKIKIGFFSTELRDHAVAKFLKGTIKSLNDNFETIAFNFTNPILQDETTKELKKTFTSWHNIHHLDDVAAVNLIREKKINILFDLVGYSARSRLELFKYRSAPIQISWIGYTNSTGISEMDYIIADPYVLDNKEYYSEKILRQPNIWSCHLPLNNEIKINELPYKKNGFITFGSFNNFAKISDNTVIVWSELLKKTKSQLILKSSIQVQKSGINNLLNRFKVQGVDLKKIKVLKRSKSNQTHLECYNKIDIALDTFPYNGATTSFESIWMGVPVLTIKGKTFNSRYGYSINKNLNLDQFIALDKNDFIKKAKLIISNYEDLSQLRKTLRKKALSSPLFDIKKFNEGFIKMIKKLTLEKQL